jgi:hypothetical protein
LLSVDIEEEENEGTEGGEKIEKPISVEQLEENIK